MIDRLSELRTRYDLWIGVLIFLMPFIWSVVVCWWPLFLSMKSDLDLDSDGLPVITQGVVILILACCLILPAWIWGIWSLTIGCAIAGRRIER